jgi:hypothetical protein
MGLSHDPCHTPCGGRGPGKKRKRLARYANGDGTDSAMSRESSAEFCVTSWCKGDANRSFVVRKPGDAAPSPTCSSAGLEAHSTPSRFDPMQGRDFHRDSCSRRDGDSGRWIAGICPPQHEWHGRCSGVFGARVTGYGACASFIATSTEKSCNQKSCNQFCPETHRGLCWPPDCSR